MASNSGSFVMRDFCARGGYVAGQDGYPDADAFFLLKKGTLLRIRGINS